MEPSGRVRFSSVADVPPPTCTWPTNRTSVPHDVANRSPDPKKYIPVSCKPYGRSQMPFTTARCRWSPIPSEYSPPSAGDVGNGTGSMPLYAGGYASHSPDNVYVADICHCWRIRLVNAVRRE